jgi:transglutaminase-like putative cysteine protease
MFTRTADQLFKDKVLGGCSDFALAEVALFRALEIPSRLVITANVDWILRYKKDPLYLTTGHVFIEVYLEDRWYLVDSTYRFLFSGYNRELKSYPRREYLCVKGVDYWEMGFAEVASFIEVAGELANRFQEDWYKDPDYIQQKI